MVLLADVRVVVAGHIPEAAARWPIRCIAAAQCPVGGVPHAYICGVVAEVESILATWTEMPLGLILDSPSSSTQLLVEVVPALASGFTAQTWESVVATVCLRHVETVQSMVLQHARRTPQKEALVYEDRRWTYQQLASMANSLGKELLARGLRPEAGPVAVQLAQSDHAVVVYLALYSFRFTVHMMDANAAGRAYRLSICPAQAFICESGAEPEPTLPTIFVDKLALDQTQQPASIEVQGELEDVVFIEYTSGSTGRPKSVAQKNGAIAHWVRMHEYHFPLVPGNDRVAFCLFFIWYWHIELCRGGTLVVFPPSLLHDVSALMRYVGRHECHRLNCLTPGLISALLEVEDELPACLQAMYSGGEALPMSTCRSWLQKFPRVELINNLAMTETAADIAWCRINQDVIQEDALYAPVTDGIITWANDFEILGEELVITGKNIAEGYLPPTVSEKFSQQQDGRWRYSSGDRASWIRGRLFMVGRVDSVVKVRGHRVDLAGLEAMMQRCAELKDVAMVTWQEMVWGVVITDDLPAVQTFAQENLPEAHLVVWRAWPDIPMTKSGKRDRQRVKVMLQEAEVESSPAPPEGSADPCGALFCEEEQRVAAAWQAVLGRRVRRDEPFLQAGGHSLSAMKLAKQLGIAASEVFAYPTIASMAARLSQAAPTPQAVADLPAPLHAGGSEGNIAIVGMAGRFPGASSPTSLWEELQAGKDLLSTVSTSPEYVPRKGMVADVGFDCAFWGIQREVAAGMDPAQRALLEVAVEALEDMGVDPFHMPGRVGVVACGGSLPYFAHEEGRLGHGLEELRTERPEDYFALEIGADKDYLPMQISYRLNLHGPSEVVQTACSSALVAVVRATQMLRLGTCSSVLAGGASFSPDAPVRKVDGMIWSPDGVCRPFADGANGTVNADGAGLIVLTRRSSDEDSADSAYAMFLGGATNNDGARKAGFSAPSLAGQVEVLRAAHAEAAVGGSQVDYLEAHGTGTKLGDPLEVQALAQVFETDRRIPLGSIKSNIGHMNTCAGIPGVIKITLMLHHQAIVPSLHASRPNTMIDWQRVPFQLSEVATAWEGRIAGVSSFGIGGTNAHAVLGRASNDADALPKHRVAREAHVWKWEPVKKEATKSRVAQEKPRTPISAQTNRAKREQSLWYETHYELVEVSCMGPGPMAVLLDGGVLPQQGLPAGAVLTVADRAIVAAQAAQHRLLFLGASEAVPGRDDTSQEELVLQVVQLIQMLAKAPRARLDIFFALRDNLRYCGVWGLLRVAAKEHPELRLRRLLLEEGAPLLLPTLPTELLLRADGAACATQLCPVPGPAVAAAAPVPCRRALVTGGLRGVGLEVADWLAQNGRAEALVLVSRRGAKGEAAARLEQLQQLCPTEVQLCDVAQAAEVGRLPDDCDLVLHCAGNTKDSLLLHVVEEAALEVLRPKVRGSLNLREKYREARLLAFSSSSGPLGPIGQAIYAAANMFLDRVMPAVQWGGWAEAGMAIDLGMTAMPGEFFFATEKGLDCLGRLLDQCSGPERPLCVLDVDWEVYRQNTAIFSPDDPLLTQIEALRAPSILGRRCRLPGDEQLLWRWELFVGLPGCRWRGTHPAWEVCQQHVVGQVPLFPATAFVVLAIAAAREIWGSGGSILLTNIAFLRPLQLGDTRKLSTTVVRAEGASSSIRFVSRPTQEDPDAPAILHCTCNVTLAPDRHEARLPDKPMPVVEDLYGSFAEAGYCYGPAFQALEFASDGSHASCKLKPLTGELAPLHPATLDVALQLQSLIHPLGCRGAPKGIRQLRVPAAATASSSSAATANARCSGGSVDVQVLDGAGRILCSVEGLESVALDAPPSLKLCRRTWRPLEGVQRGTWLASGAEAVALGLPETTSDAKKPHEAVVHVVRADTIEDVHRCREEAQQTAAKQRCWVVALEDSPFAEAAAAAAVEVGAQAVIGVAGAVRAAAQDLGVTAPMVRVADGQLLRESLVLAQENEEPRKLVATAEEAFKVAVDSSRGARGAQCRLATRRCPEAHEVELLTSIWALNFRDVLVAVGAISAEVAGHTLGIGGECYGKVVRVGSAVANLAVGDMVMAVPPDGMGSYLTTDARWVSCMPGFTPEEAVSGTCAYATAWLGLHWMAHISPGDRVLVHSAAGGIGLAAVHICLRQGCKVYCTASTVEKRDLLLSLGVAGVFDSRNVAAFEGGIRSVTDGEGVDVVLNSLSGDAILASVQLLRPFGRFIELGKRDQYNDTRLGLAPFLGGLTYAAAHFDVLMLQQPDRCRRLLEEVWREMPELPRLPSKIFPLGELSEALEYFSKGIHVGKILVRIEETPVLPRWPAAVAGPDRDGVTKALRLACGATDGQGGILCVPELSLLPPLLELAAAEVVVTASKAVAALARAVQSEGAVCLELPRWELLAGLDECLLFGGSLVASEEESGAADLAGWLAEVMQEIVGAPVALDETFESAGFDSLSLISLARRISSKVGTSVSVADLFERPTPARLLAAFSGAPQPQVVRPRAICLHGFRSNKEAMSLQVAPFVNGIGAIEWIFINAPRRASGPADPHIPDDEAFEWWGQQSAPYETAWMDPKYDGLRDTLPLVERLKPVGVVGFSQGAAVAALVQCATWCALFSAISAPGLQESSASSFHCFDPNDSIANQCVSVSNHFSKKQVHIHSAGHNIPRDDDALVKCFANFVAEQL